LITTNPVKTTAATKLRFDLSIDLSDTTLAVTSRCAAIARMWFGEVASKLLNFSNPKCGLKTKKSVTPVFPTMKWPSATAGPIALIEARASTVFAMNNLQRQPSRR
jgi:hypothetical protein